MNFILLTQYDGKIVGPIAKILGILMDGLFKAISAIGIPNIGLAIFLFTIIVNIILLPLTINQQKNMKLNSALAPELSKIQAKYKGKRDQDSMAKQQKETQQIYDKYGYNPTSGCLPLVIQMPILFALYRVIYQIPGYVTAIKEQFTIIANAALSQDGFTTKIAELASSNMVKDATNFDGSTVESMNHIIDLLYKFDSSEWTQFKNLFPNIADTISEPLAKINEYNSFLFGIQLNEAPGYKLSIALIIPFLAWFTQWLSMKVTTTQQPSGNPDDPTNATMKSMNTFMPLFSAFICITLPAGLGVYWIASAVVRTVIQVILNKHFDKIGSEAIIAQSVEKQNKKRAKQGLPEINTDGSYVHGGKNAAAAADTAEKAPVKKMPKMAKNTADSTNYYDTDKQYEKGSIASRARMVKDFNENNSKKDKQ